MATLMRRLRAGPFTVHGFRSSFRDWKPASCSRSRKHRWFTRQLTKSTVLSAQISTLDTSADLPSAYFPRKST